MSYTSSNDEPGGLSVPALSLDPAILHGTVRELPDGGAEIVPADDEAALGPEHVPHRGNLAEVLDDNVLAALSADLLEGIDADVESNRPLHAILTAGRKLLGLNPAEAPANPKLKDIPASRHPILKEALQRFVATAMGELLPATGPARCQVYGDKDEAREAVADRKAGYLNYRLTVYDPEYADDFEQGTVHCALDGTVFRKVWRDPLRGGDATSRYYTLMDVVVASNATTLAGPYRVTQIEPLPKSELKRLQLKAWFRDVDLSEPVGGELTPRREAGQEGGTEVRLPTDRWQDADYVVYHCHCLLDIEGMEHQGADGEPDGLPLPYVVSIDRDSRKVLRVERNWKEGDDACRPLERFVVYRFFPSTDFHGWGLIHLIGSDAAVLTSMRQMGLINIAFGAFPGGIKSNSVKGDTSDLSPGLGEFVNVDTGNLPIQQSVMPLPYKDLPPSFQPFQAEVLAAAQRVAATTDVATGDLREDALPGTVLALIKRAAVVEGNIVKRFHRSQAKELRLYADLLGEDSNDGTPINYPYVVQGKAGQAISSDFRDNADIVPVADPNTPTQTERLGLAQAKLTVVSGNGGNARAAAIAMLRTMGSSDAEVDELFPPPPQAQPADPVTEFGMAMHGLPLKAGPAQNHVAHVQAHMGQAAVPGLPPPVMQALAAHIGEHTALFYAAQAQAMGVPPGQPGMPPQMEGQIAAAVAQASGALHQAMMQLAPPQAGPAADPMRGQELQLQAAELAAQQTDEQRKALASARQDQVEVMRLRVQSSDGDKDRAANLEKARLDLERERVKAHGATSAAMVQHVVGPAIGVAHEEANHEARNPRRRHANAGANGGGNAAPWLGTPGE